jgi:integrase
VRYNTITTDGHYIWQISEVEQFISHHKVGSKAVLGMALLLFTGQRRGDVIRMGPQHVKDGFINLRQGKTKSDVAVPSCPRCRRSSISQKSAISISL